MLPKDRSEQTDGACRHLVLLWLQNWVAFAVAFPVPVHVPVPVLAAVAIAVLLCGFVFVVAVSFTVRYFAALLNYYTISRKPRAPATAPAPVSPPPSSTVSADFRWARVRQSKESEKERQAQQQDKPLKGHGQQCAKTNWKGLLPDGLQEWGRCDADKDTQMQLS